MLNDLERKRAELAQRAEDEQVDRCVDLAATVLTTMPTCAPAETMTALMLAALGAADQLNIPRDEVVEAFADLAKNVTLIIREVER